MCWMSNIYSTPELFNVRIYLFCVYTYFVPLPPRGLKKNSKLQIKPGPRQNVICIVYLTPSQQKRLLLFPKVFDFHNYQKSVWSNFWHFTLHYMQELVFDSNRNSIMTFFLCISLICHTVTAVLTLM